MVAVNATDRAAGRLPRTSTSGFTGSPRPTITPAAGGRSATPIADGRWTTDPTVGSVVQRPSAIGVADRPPAAGVIVGRGLPVKPDVEVRGSRPAARSVAFTATIAASSTGKRRHRAGGRGESDGSRLGSCHRGLQLLVFAR